MTEAAGAGPADDEPCEWCGHGFALHNDACLDGWVLVDGDIAPGDDACECVCFGGPQP